tara:strand:- start:799 stop:1029 length:231 start_codon:yes stop_codon:yes gene_type:complete
VIVKKEYAMKKNTLKIEPRYIIDSSGNRKEVILDISTFEKMLEYLEDSYFAKEAEQILKEEDFVDFEEANKDIVKK